MLIRLLTKILWSLLGSLSLAGGIIGLILPIIPQIPFFIMAIWCFAKISPRFHRWVIHLPLVQRYLVPLMHRFNPRHLKIVLWGMKWWLKKKAHSKM